MNREIKFRVWHKELKRFLTKEEYCLDFDGKLIFLEMDECCGREDYVTLISVNPNLYVIQQFTGLKDRNDKDIYEGDIIYWRVTPNTSPIAQSSHGEIVYSSKGSAQFCLKMPEYGISYCFNPVILNENFTVVGNIFENPELLIDEKDYSKTQMSFRTPCVD